jgi:hypothetical protein
MGFIGTDITEKDAEIILTSLVKTYSVIPSSLKQYIPSLETILEAIPDEARKYSIEDIVKLLDWAAKNQIVI